MTNNKGLVPVVVVIWIAIGTFIAGGLASYLLLGRSVVASVGLGLILGIIIAPSLMTVIYKWLGRYEKK